MQVYTLEEAHRNALKYFKGDELAAHVWVNKYALKNEEELIVEASPEERFIAIAMDLNRINKKYGEADEFDLFVKSLIKGTILPGGSGLYGIANPYSTVSLGNCFVTSGNNEDSIGSIWKQDQEAAQIYKRRGGNGTDISHLRPSGTLVSNAAGSTTGPISFADQFSATVRRIGQNGRRGALMLSMHINHPNVLQFIQAKNNGTAITGANVSVKLTDDFMSAVKNDGCYLQRFPVTAPEISSMELVENEVYKTPEGVQYIKVRARTIFDELVRVNWESAEPGALFWDKIISESPSDCYPNFPTHSTNPCGELPLSPYDSCRLLSVNLTQHVVNPFTKKAYFDVTKFKNTVSTATRMMDNIIDLEIEKIQGIIDKILEDPESSDTKKVELELWRKVLENTNRGRRAGISIIGHGDFLAMLGMPYGDVESSNFIEDIHQKFALYVYHESVNLAESRGSFIDFNPDLEVDNPFLNRLYAVDPTLYERMFKFGRRNIALLTIPPSGTLSIILRQSSGIEPVFLLYYMRRRKVNPGDDARIDFVDELGDSWQEYIVLHPKFEDWLEQNYSLELIDDFVNGDLSQEKIDIIISETPWYGSLANDIDPIQKVKLQGRIQKWVDHAISVTHNLPENVTKETIADLYITSWESGCKGCTVYRDGSRSGVLVKVKEEEKKEEKFESRDAPKRPRELLCDIYFPTINKERYVVIVGLYNGKPYEVFAFKYQHTIPMTMSKGILKKQRSGHYNLLDISANIVVDNIRDNFELPEWDFVTRMISTALRHGASIDFIVEQLNKSGKDAIVTDLSRVIARQLKKYLKKIEESGVPCPECGEPLKVEGGCAQCMNPECGYGKCG